VVNLISTVDAQEITLALGGKWNGRSGSARCPAHPDQHPSLSVSEGSDGKILVHCHTGCAQADVIDTLKSRNLWPEHPPTPQLRVHRNGVAENPHYDVPPRSRGAREVAVYDYRDEAGQVLYQAVRFENPKTFRQRRVLPDGTTPWGLEGVRLVLYRLPELQAADPALTVFVVEGEKDADRLIDAGLIATTSPLGAGKWRDEYAELLKGRHVVVIPDNDRPGREHADAVVASLLGVAASVRLMPLDVADKGDVSDWLDAGHTSDEVEIRAAAIEPLARPRPEYPVRTLAELMAQEHVPGAQILEGLIWKGKIHWLFARANSGKTVWALVKGLHVAAGKPFCGRWVEQGPVLFISEDSPDSVIQEYIETLCDLYDIHWDGLPFYINEQHGLRIESDDDIKKAQEAYESCPQAPVYVIVDSCESLVPSESYTPKEFDPFGRYIRWMSDRGSAVEVIDHARKDTKETQGMNLLEKLYGSIAKGKVADIAVFLDGSFKEGLVVAKWAKFRGNFPPPLEIKFRSDTGFELRDVLGTELTPTEHKITRWFNENGSGWKTVDEIISGTGISERSARRALPRLSEIRWLLCEGTGGRDGLRYRRNPDAGKVFR
jgi:ferredoxin